jgi:hypothetical protein
MVEIVFKFNCEKIEYPTEDCFFKCSVNTDLVMTKYYMKLFFSLNDVNPREFVYTGDS